MKTFFDSELAISENSVRPATILHNSSLIMGRQIINILPEGYVSTGVMYSIICLVNADLR